MTVRILTGDVRERLADLPDGSVQCVVTSPPYFGLRSYSTPPQVWGGDLACQHEWTKQQRSTEIGKGNWAQGTNGRGEIQPGGVDAKRSTLIEATVETGWCVHCGAWLGHFGLEPTLAMFIEHLVAVFRDVRRVLRDDGTVWLNLGDSYWTDSPVRRSSKEAFSETWDTTQTASNGGNRRTAAKTGTFKNKDLMMVPARVALALQDDGWWLRSDIIWAKRNCMPESVTDRPTSSHEHIFLLTKQSRYFYDAEAVREKIGEPVRMAASFRDGGVYTNNRSWQNNGDTTKATHGDGEESLNGRNQRNVWHLAIEPFPESHFATFPTEIPRRAIRAGTSEKGQCPACGAPWVRVVERQITESRQKSYAGATLGAVPSHRGTVERPCQFVGGVSETTGWQPSCACDAGDPIPQTVLDPFAGAGTTLLVADQLGRHGIGIELNPEYAEMARRRVYNDAPLFAELVAD